MLLTTPIDHCGEWMFTASHVHKPIGYYYSAWTTIDEWRLVTAEAASLCTASPVVTGVCARLRQQKLFVYTLPNRDVKSLPFSWPQLNNLSMAVLVTSGVFKYSRSRLLIITEAFTTSSLWEIILSTLNTATTLNGNYNIYLFIFGKFKKSKMLMLFIEFFYFTVTYFIVFFVKRLRPLFVGGAIQIHFDWLIDWLNGTWPVCLSCLTLTKIVGRRIVWRQCGLVTDGTVACIL